LGLSTTFCRYFEIKSLNVFLILKIQNQKRRHSGNDLSRNRSFSENAGISPYDSQSLDFYFSYRQQIVDIVELSA